MKIALVGSAPSSIALGPYRDRTYTEFQGGHPGLDPKSQHAEERWEIWGCSPGAMPHVPRADRWFEVHRWEPGQPWLQPAYLNFLRDFRGPVYVGGYIPKEECPNGLIYPIEQVEAEFSSYFLSSSLSLMFAMAIMEIEGRRNARGSARAIDAAIKARVARKGEVAANESDRNMSGMDPDLMAQLLAEKDIDDCIGMWGVDMAAAEEYGDQRSGCHFFILECLRRGIGYFCPPESDLLRPKPIYGLSEWDWGYIKATQRGRELGMQHAEAQTQFAEAQKKLYHIAGYQAGFTDFINTWMSPYGMPAGTVLHLDPDKPGLGGGVTIKPGTPVKMAVPSPAEFASAGAKLDEADRPTPEAPPPPPQARPEARKSRNRRKS